MARPEIDQSLRDQINEVSVPHVVLWLDEDREWDFRSFYLTQWEIEKGLEDTLEKIQKGDIEFLPDEGGPDA